VAARLAEAGDLDLARASLVVVVELRAELEVRREDLLHQERAGDRLQHVVDRDLHQIVVGVRLGDEVRELGVRLVFAVARATAMIWMISVNEPR